MDRNCALCPETAKALARIPGMKTGQFSILTPGTHLVPHKGPYAGVLRCHLGLKVPERKDDLWIKVGRSRRTWEEGKVLIFDETHTHEALNGTDETRVVLFIDFKRPLPWWADALNELMLRLIARTSHIQGSLRGGEEWEKSFHHATSAKAIEAPVAA
jgi:beta-hydroxylase